MISFSKSIYSKHKKKIIGAFIVNSIIVAITFGVILPGLGRVCNRSPFTRDISRIKQIGTTVAMYFTNGDIHYPVSPRKFDLDKYIISDAIEDTWYSLSSTSPYYFFPDEDDTYSGSASVPLAVRKIPKRNYNQCTIVYEDGHIKNISPLNAKILIFIYETYKEFKYLQKHKSLENRNGVQK